MARPAQVGEVFVDEEGAVMIVERAFAADEELDLFDPGGMVDQIFEPGAGLIDLLQVQAVGRPELMAVDVTGPLVHLQGQDGIDLGIAGGDFVGGQGVFEQ